MTFMDYRLAMREKRYLHDGDPGGLLSLLPGTKTRNTEKPKVAGGQTRKSNLLGFLSPGRGSHTGPSAKIAAIIARPDWSVVNTDHDG